MDVQELRRGLWRWTAPHPEWKPGDDWPREVGCVYAECPGAIVLIDPQVPEDEDAARFWRALDRDRERLADREVVVLVSVSWHERSAAAVAERYGASLWSPDVGAALPEGVEAEVVAAPDWTEALVVLPAYGALVTGDLIAGNGAGGLRAPVEWVDEDQRPWVVPQLRAALGRIVERPLELVLPSHGDPILGGAPAALERALHGLERYGTEP
jgi:glyoxylase-like metal-dependent hydrolase (beta-lactamase superfamily II)